MKKLIYSIGVTLFLAFLAFHVTTSLTNPFFGVSVEALAYGSGSGSSGGCYYWDGTTIKFKCGPNDGCCWKKSSCDCVWNGNPTYSCEPCL